MPNEKRKLSTLVIEDHEIFRKLALNMLSDYTTYFATTLDEGKNQFKEHQPDITFIDISLPDGSGHSLVNYIKSVNPDAFMVMLTGSKLECDVKESLKNGVQGYIIKPFSRQKIKECIANYYSHTQFNIK